MTSIVSSPPFEKGGGTVFLRTKNTRGVWKFVKIRGGGGIPSIEGGRSFQFLVPIFKIDTWIILCFR